MTLSFPAFATPAMEALSTLDAASDTLAAGSIAEALDCVFATLEETREQLSSEEWADFSKYVREEHELRHSVREDPMTARALDKPRGYAGDAVMMDYLYGIHSSLDAAAQASEFGRALYGYIQQRPAGQAVRYRREHIAGLIDKMAAERPEAKVLAIAAGHLREAEKCKALAEGRLGRFVALDADAESMAEVKRCYGEMGLETIHGSVRHILARKVGLEERFDFVYAAGLYDYLNAPVAQALTERMFEMTEAGGKLLIPNFAPQVRDRAYMETFMDWHLIYRDEYDMAGLLARIDPAQIASFEIYTDPSDSVVYLEVTKAAC